MADLPISRRTLAYGIALSAFAAPKRLDAPHPDAALLELGRRMVEAESRYVATSIALDEADARYVSPPTPEALFVRRGDSIAFRVGAVPRDGRLWLGDDVEEIRTLPCGWSYQEDDGSTGWQSSGEEARRDEIVAAYAAWRADCDAARDASGLSAAESAFEAALQAASGLKREILNAPVSTLAGVRVKAHAVAWGFGGLAGLEEIVDLKSASDQDGGALVVLRDLLGLATGGVAA